MLPVIGSLRPWADPTQVQINRLPMHVPLPLGADARKSLDGEWHFRLYDTPETVPPSAVRGDTPEGGRRLAVPGNWTLQGVGDLPHYTNVQMPFPGPPPALPQRNPTGVYRRTFTTGRGWKRHRVVLHIGGAESVHAVYLNDTFVGYGTDSRLPSEYDITDVVQSGVNHLAIVVIRYSAQSYVEDQDQWWMAGLHRSVWIEARSPVHIADVVARPIVSMMDGQPDGRAELNLDVTVGFSGVAPSAGHTVRATLVTPKGRVVAGSGRQRQPSAVVPHTFAEPYVFTGHRVTLSWQLADAALWSVEMPNRYRVDVELCDPSGRVLETTSHMVGFRHVEVRDRQLLVNGQPIWIFGVNRHDHHPDRGKAITVDDMRADLVAMRAHNITAIRTSHYPNDSAFYDLCDELGMYVVDEANIESHGYNTSLCHDPRFRATWVERGARMVQRDRNHPSIIMWSLGNESGYGANHDALAGWIRRADPSRPLHYEGAVFHDGWVDGGVTATDVVCPMYATIDAIRSYGAAGEGHRPLILCEYSHAMGNSNGSLADYWEAITSTPGLQGGFLWEWKDHGLRHRYAGNGRDVESTRLRYGGEFGDVPHDCNFVADGLMSADLEPHPVMREVAWVYRPVTVELVRGKLRITNRQSFRQLDWLRATWGLRIDGELAARGVLDVPAVAPGASVDVDLPCQVPMVDAEAHLSVRWETRTAQWYAPAGHLTAWDQVSLPRPKPRRQALSKPPASSAGRAAVDDVLVSAPTLNLWRAATDNDGFKLMPDLAKRLRIGGQGLTNWQTAGVDTADPERLVTHEARRWVDASGAAVHHHVVDVPAGLADLPRVGVTFALPGRFSWLRWFGHGPGENYPDRNAGSPLGTWEAPVDECPYLVPQEFGLRTDCRWFEFIDPAAGQSVRLTVDVPMTMHVSATHYTPADLFAAPTFTALTPRSELIVCADVAHRGLGTASCGPDVLPQYRLSDGRYEFRYRLSLSTL